MVLDAVNAELEGVPEAQVEVIRVQALQKYISPHAFGGRNAEKGTWDGRPPAHDRARTPPLDDRRVQVFRASRARS